MPDPGLYERLVDLALEREIGQPGKDRRNAWTELSIETFISVPRLSPSHSINPTVASAAIARSLVA